MGIELGFAGVLTNNNGPVRLLINDVQQVQRIEVMTRETQEAIPSGRSREVNL